MLLSDVSGSSPHSPHPPLSPAPPSPSPRPPLSPAPPSPFSDSIVRSRLYQARAQARASLSQPSRPLTPRDKVRHLFRSHSPTAAAHTDGSRPTSAFRIDADADADADFSVGADAERVPVLVKLVRLLAHLAIDADAGVDIAAAEEAGLLVDLMHALPADGLDTCEAAEEELLLNVLSALTNLSYYHTTSNHILRQQARLCRLLLPALLHPNEECQLEAARTLGNLALHANPDAVAVMVELRLHEALLLLLEHPTPAVAEASAGTLTNLAADATGSGREALVKAAGAERLAAALPLLLEPAAEADEAAAAAAAAAAVLCMKTLCNLLCGSGGGGGGGRGVRGDAAGSSLSASTVRQLALLTAEAQAEAEAEGWPDCDAKTEWPEVAAQLRGLLHVGGFAVVNGVDARPRSVSDRLEELPAREAEGRTVSVGV